MEIPDDNGKNYLDWNKQIPIGTINRVANQLQKQGWERTEYKKEGIISFEKDGDIINLYKNGNGTGEGLYEDLASVITPQGASELLSDAGFAGIKYPADNMRGGREDGAKNYVIFKESDAKIVDHTRFSVRQANKRFNEELEKQIDGTLPKGHVYQLGKPSSALRYAGIEDLPIELSSETLETKSSVDYKSDHPFNLESVKNLPIAIQRPVAVFDSENRNGRKVILTELNDEKGHPFIAVLGLRRLRGRNYAKVNSIVSLYGKDSAVRIAKWFDSKNKNGLGLDVDLCKWADTKKRLNG